MGNPTFVILRPPPGTVVENLNLVGSGETGDPSSEYGIFINCYPAPSDPTYVCKGLVIRNNTVSRYNKNIAVVGPNIGTQIYGNVSFDATGNDKVMASGGHCHGLYTEGLQQGCSIHDNVLRNNGWWPTYDPNTQLSLANMNHGWYGNESAGMDDTTSFFNNVVIDNNGSNVGCRHSLKAWNNVFRGTSDWDLIVGQYGKADAVLFGNAHFAPRRDAVPYYGGGIHLLCPGQIAGNQFANTNGTTVNPATTDSNNFVVPQIGVWPKAGCTIRPVGSPVPTIEQWCKLAYGVADVSAIKPGDAPKIVSWLANQLVTPPVVVVPGPAPAAFDVTCTIDPTAQTIVQKTK